MLFNKVSLYKISLLSLGLCLSLTACVQLKTVSLYDGEEPEPIPQKPSDIALIVEPIIYNEDASDVWGLEKDICKEASISRDIAYSGNESLKISWNRGMEGCKFAGIGIGWDGYAGKDLSEIMDFVAIQMYVRNQEGKSFGLPIVLTLEDYSGGMGFAYTGNKYFERTTIDEEWQKVVVPLNSFDLETENLDPSNIKQLQLELQQSGSVYIDDIRLVFYEPEPQEAWMEEEVLPSPLAMPIQILDDAFINNNVWGLITDPCQKIELSNSEASEGEKSLYLKWDNRKNSCKLTSFGISWNKWHPVDITSIKQSVAFEFDIKSVGGDLKQLPLKIGFEDYDRVRRFVNFESKFVKGGKYTSDWKQVTIPFSEVPEGLDLTRIKHIQVNLEGAGEVYIDNMRLVKIKRS